MWESEISQLKEENCCLREENEMLRNQIKDLREAHTITAKSGSLTPLLVDEKAYRKILLRQQYFANLLQILICAVSDLPKDSVPSVSLKEISEEIDEMLLKAKDELHG